MAEAIITRETRRSKGMNRREMMKYHMVALASMSVGAKKAGAAEPETSVQKLFCDWMDARERTEQAFAAHQGDEAELLHEEQMRLADEIMWIEAQTPADTLRKLLAYTDFGAHEPRDGVLGHMLYGEASHWVGGVTL